MAQQSNAAPRWIIGIALMAGVLGFALLVVLFLVLTGIIAEPETVIESVIRALTGQ